MRAKKRTVEPFFIIYQKGKGIKIVAQTKKRKGAHEKKRRNII